MLMTKRAGFSFSADFAATAIAGDAAALQREVAGSHGKRSVSLTDRRFSRERGAASLARHGNCLRARRLPALLGGMIYVKSVT